MSTEAIWFVLIGGLLLTVALAKDAIARLPLTGAIVYLIVGFLLGPAAAGILTPDLTRDTHVLRLITEAGLVVSLFSIGLHLRIPFWSRMWRLPFRLGLLAMAGTVAILTAAGRAWLHLPLGLALLLAACLAPTDPVLASELRPREAGDDEPVRFALSSEGGCNDGSTMPVAIVGIFLVTSSANASVNYWLFGASVVWGAVGAVAIGALVGFAVSWLVTELRVRRGLAVGLEGFFALGIMAVCYGTALICHTYGFLAVFCAGLTLRMREQQSTGSERPNEVLRDVTYRKQGEVARDRRLAPAYMTESMMAFTINIERIVELALMLLIGSVISAQWRSMITWESLWPVLLLLIVARPLSVYAALLGGNHTKAEQGLIAWLGVRGVGTFYYLLFAVEQVGAAFNQRLQAIALSAIAVSVFVHGASATIALKYYER